MVKKLFTQLKQDHSNLGLSDEIIQAYAESLASTGLVTDENLATVSKGQEKALKAFQSSFDKERTEKSNFKKELDELKKKPEIKPEEKKDDLEAKIEAKIQSMVEEKIKPYKEKIESYESKEAKAARQNLILSKAKELNISQARIDEGFVIADDADESAINAYLSKVAQNEVAKGLESKNNGVFALSTPEEKGKELAKDWASKLPDA